MFEAFAAERIDVGETAILLRRAGSGPPPLLLHGFPQTHLLWRGVAPRLARDVTVVRADLRGCGQSGCPASAPDHAPYAKRDGEGHGRGHGAARLRPLRGGRA